MGLWDVEQVVRLAPDPASAKAGQGLARAAKWSGIGATDRAVWGLCQGSGKQPYQTTVDNLARRSGPGASYSRYPGLLPIGSLAWVTCQRAGSTVGTTAVWDRLTDGSWVTDYYVATPSNTTYSAPIRRC